MWHRIATRRQDGFTAALDTSRLKIFSKQTYIVLTKKHFYAVKKLCAIEGNYKRYIELNH